MLRLLFVVLALPYWAYFVLAAGFGYLTEEFYEFRVKDQSERVQALSHGPPALVNLSDFRRDADIGPVNEVNVEGWINPDYNYNLTEYTNGTKSGARSMYLMFGQGDTADTKVVRAALVFTASEKAEFLDNANTYMTGVAFGAGHFVFNFNGFGSKSDSFSKLVKGAIKEQNLTMGPNFIYVSPFFDGREAALTPRGAPDKYRMNMWLFAAAVAFFGLVKFGFGRGKKAKRASSPMAARSPVPQASVPQATVMSADAIVAPQLAQFTTAPAQKAVRKTEKKFPMKMAILVGVVVAGVLRPALVGALLPFVMVFGFFALQFFGLQKIKQFAGSIAGKATSLIAPKQTFTNAGLPASSRQPTPPAPTAMAQASQSAAFDRWAASKPKSAVPTSRFAAKDSFSDGPIQSGSAGLFGRFAKKKSLDPFEKLAQARKSF